MPVSFLLSSGMTLPTALAAPVDEGMMFSRMPRPPRQSLLDGPSTTFWLAVAACTVVIRPRLMPHLSLSTLAIGARQLVVHEALAMIASPRSEEHTSELQSLMRLSYADFFLKKTSPKHNTTNTLTHPR